MARKLRYEEEGGLYHVINRGNYRHPVFGSVGAAQAFETALWEVVTIYRWRVHAYVLMNNHYHLALETPQPNLSGGMHWLHSTFATRFNRFRKERGHLFQGRYHALAVENSHALATVVDYIHLNPVRGKLVTAEQLPHFRWCSLRRFLRGDRPAGLIGDLVMTHHNLPDTSTGWQHELERLVDLANDEEEQKRRGFETLSQGWAIGTAGWKAARAKQLSQKDLVGLAQAEAREIKLWRWTVTVDESLKKLRKTRQDLTPLKKQAREEPWRWALALELRALGASYAWIAEQLGYPSVASLRVRMHRVNLVNN